MANFIALYLDSVVDLVTNSSTSMFVIPRYAFDESVGVLRSVVEDLIANALVEHGLASADVAGLVASDSFDVFYVHDGMSAAELSQLIGWPVVSVRQWYDREIDGSCFIVENLRGYYLIVETDDNAIPTEAKQAINDYFFDIVSYHLD